MKRKYLVVVLFLAVALVTNVIISSAAAEGRWVLQNGYPQVNPNNDLLEWYGGEGGTPGWYGEPRFNGKFRIYTVSETSFSFEDREVDYEFEYWHVILQSDFNFDKPSNVLIPGETVNLNVNFLKSGVVTDGNPGIQFQLMGFGIDIQPAIGFNYYPWDPNFGGVSSTTFSFVVPDTHGGEILMDAFLVGNSPGCLVRWAYEAEESTTTIPPTTTSTTSPTTTSTTTTTCSYFQTKCGPVCCEWYESCEFDVFCVNPFIACPAEYLYGEDSEEVELLRAFRDEVLSQSPVGQEIIKLYYEWSPVIVKAMENDEEFKSELKEIIDEVLLVIGGIE